MKKLTVLFLIVILIFATTACNSTNSDVPNQNSNGNLPADNGEKETSPDAQTPEFISESIIIGDGTPWELAGLLTLPANIEGKIPAVVLVHGSGPGNMDGVPLALSTPNTPFKDIAEYLSLNGIAAIRYDKRTFTHGTKMLTELGGSLTVFEETIEDAILAAELLRADPRIDENRVYILGHSLGGMLAPRIHAMGGNFAGLILFAGSPRSLIEILGDQQLLIAKETMEGEALAEVIALFESGIIAEQTAEILALSDDEAKAVIDPSGASLYYYKDLLINPASNFIKDITVPFLVMHADNDLQVFTDKDFAMYKELLGDRDNVTFKLYEGLNHFFMPGTVTNIVDILDEYMIKANVDEQVLRDIVAWIRAN